MQAFHQSHHSEALRYARGNHIWRVVDTALILGACILTFGSCALWWLRHWYLFPVWVPLPGPGIMGFLNFLEPIILVVIGGPILIVYPGVCLVQLIRAIHLCIHWQVYRFICSFMILIVLGALPGLWWLGPTIDEWLLQQGRTHYDQTIAAIEQYKHDHGDYPASLNDLAPDYLPAAPAIIFKFGEQLQYEPTPKAWFDYAPFTFEIYGHRGLHGQTFKYCPISAEPCYETDGHFSYRRIDANWIWLYSSAL